MSSVGLGIGFAATCWVAAVNPSSYYNQGFGIATFALGVALIVRAFIRG